MNNIQNIISKALATWSTKHAVSTVKCQGIYFSIMKETAEKNGFDLPCQELYDIFLNNATTSATYFSRTQVVKAVDLEAGTHAINKDGCFYNEPAFPTFEEASNLLSSLDYPIVESLDISIIIAYAAGVIKQQGTYGSCLRQYWCSWRDIRTYFFIHNYSMDYNQKILNQYLNELDEKFAAGSVSETRYYVHRKAALIIGEIVETRQYQWKRSLRKAIRPLESPALENIRQQYLSFLRKSNYAEGTIRGRDYIFRNMMKFAGIQSAEELLAKLAEYKPLAKIEEIEEQNYNMIDDRLNNGVEKFNREEEKKEQQEKPQVRSSLKQRLAAKQKEVAQGQNKDAREQDKTKKTNREEI